MDTWSSILDTFVRQANQAKDLKTSSYPKEYGGLKVRVSFGMGMPARVPWIAFIAPEMQVSKGFYPVYLYYKEFATLILAYGVSETEEFGETWPPKIMNSSVTIASFFDTDVPRYGDSFVFKAYRVDIKEKEIKYASPENNLRVSPKDIEIDLGVMLEYYRRTVAVEATSPTSAYSQGIFYMEKQLEDFIIYNWAKTELGKKYDLIIEGGALVSQQFRTDIGQIDILARDKKTKSYVVIELKKNQTSDDTVGQLTRYMGWIKEKKNDAGVKGVIIAGEYDQKLDYALQMVPNCEVFLYQVDFKLKKFQK